LRSGLYGDHDTDGHVDNLARFYAPGRVLLAWTDIPSNPSYGIVRLAEEALRRGGITHITHLPLPDIPVVVEADKTEEGFRFPIGATLTASYANYIVTNELVIVPAFGAPNEKSDTRAAKIIGEAFPGRRVVPIEGSTEIVMGGGGLHCISQTEFTP